jgi:hypothetical protein
MRSPASLQIQEASREFFQKALPFMLKAHDMNPNRDGKPS